MLDLPLWRAGREHLSLDTRTLLDYRGRPVARVAQAPVFMVPHAADALRRAAPGWDEEPGERWAAIARAGDLFERAELAGLDLAACGRLVTLTTGSPIRCTLRALSELAAGLRGIEDALRWQAPGGDLSVFRERRVIHEDGRSYAWVPVGRVLGFVAPSNHPTVHLTWVLALAMGWSVLIRPGSDDPFTPLRLVHALDAAGFPTDRIALLPGGHDLVPAVVEACDRTVAYGGPSLEPLLGRDRRVLFNGPGHSKVLVDAPVDLEPTAEFLESCILHDGGRKCTCASAVLVRGEAPGLLERVAARLDSLPLLDPLDLLAQVPAWRDRSLLVGRDGSLPAGIDLVEADGLRFVRPALVLDPAAERLELPAPWATGIILPSGADPLPLLRGSLAVTLLSDDLALYHSCLMEPSIRKVFRGRIPPWQTRPGAPHQGRLSEFLFTSKYAPAENRE